MKNDLFFDRRVYGSCDVANRRPSISSKALIPVSGRTASKGFKAVIDSPPTTDSRSGFLSTSHDTWESGGRCRMAELRNMLKRLDS
jgi:hypothetical protein